MTVYICTSANHSSSFAHFRKYIIKVEQLPYNSHIENFHTEPMHMKEKVINILKCLLCYYSDEAALMNTDKKLTVRAFFSTTQ